MAGLYCGLSFFQLDRWQAPTQRPIIDQCPVVQTSFQREIKDLVTMDIPRLYKFLAGTSKAHVLDKGIRQKSTKRVNSFIACSAFCPGHPTVTPGTPRNDGVYTRQSPWWHAFLQNIQKSECVYRRSPIGRPKTICRFLRHPMRTG